MTEQLDEWIASKSEMDFKRLHAIGVIGHYWNISEIWLYQLFSAVSGARHPWAMIFDLGDVAICTRIRTVLELEADIFRYIVGYTPTQREQDNQLLSDYVTHILDVYDLCRQNRNTTLHAWVDYSDGEPRLARKSKRPDKEVPEPFPCTLADLRRVADDIERLNGRMERLLEWCWSSAREKPPLASLEKPSLPELLWKPPRQVHTRPQRQP